MVATALSGDGLKNLSSIYLEHDFEFVFNEKSYLWNSLLADFLSPKIAKLHSADPSFRRFEISLDMNIPYDLFQAVLDLSIGKSIDLNESNIFYVARIARELENIELMNKCRSSVLLDSVSDVIEQIKLNQTVGIIDDESIEFVAAHFDEFAESEFEELGAEILSLVVSHSSLKLSDEDTLSSLARSLSSKDSSYFVLFRDVHFEYLSVNEMQLFCEFFLGNSEFSIDAGIWKRLMQRLCIDISPHVKENFSRYNKLQQYQKIDLTYKGRPAEGIINYLTDQCGGNVHDYGVVDISGGPVQDGSQLKSVADLKSNSFFISCDQREDHTICYDFKEMRVVPSAYMLKSWVGHGAGAVHLRSWVIEISTDKSTWTVIDRKDDNHELNADGVVKVFDLGNASVCRYIRLRQTGPSHCVMCGNRFTLTCFEIFGTLLRV